MVLQRAFLYFACFLFSNVCVLAKDNVGILLQKLETAKHDSERVHLLTKLSGRYLHVNPDSSLYYARKAYSIASKYKEPRQLADVYYYLAESSLRSSLLDSAYVYLELEKSLRIAIKDTYNLAFNYRKFGDLYYQKGQLIKATKNYTAAFRLWNLTKKTWDCANVSVDMGNVNYTQRKYDEAIMYYKRATVGYLEKHDTASAQAVQLNIASIYMEQERYDESRQVMKNIKENELNKHPVEVIHVYHSNNLTLSAHFGEFDKAKYFLEKTIYYYQKTESPLVKMNHAMAMTQYYLALKNYKQSIEWGLKLKDIAKETHTLDYERMAFNLLARSYSGSGNFEKAFECMVSFDQIKDTIMSSENRRQVTELQSEFESEKKDLENQSLRAESKAKDAELEKSIAESKRQNVMVISFAIGLVLSTVFLYLIYRSLRENKKKNKIIEEQKKEVDRAYLKLDVRNKEVIDSIKYAKRIQQTLMSSEKYIDGNLKRLSKSQD